MLTILPQEPPRPCCFLCTWLVLMALAFVGSCVLLVVGFAVMVLTNARVAGLELGQ